MFATSNPCCRCCCSHYQLPCRARKKTAQKQAATTAVATDGNEIDPYSNLVFTFDEKVVDEDQQNRWDTTRFVTFSPNIRGKFK